MTTAPGVTKASQRRARKIGLQTHNNLAVRRTRFHQAVRVTDLFEAEHPRRLGLVGAVRDIPAAALGWFEAQAQGGQPSSGNHAFDDYRAETLRRLEEEQREFLQFLERLRHAKDKAEFDQFMAERRGMRDVTPPPQQQ